MKTSLTVLSVVLLATDAMAFVGRTQHGYRDGDSATRITDSGAGEVKKKGAAEKKIRAKAKEITATKKESTPCNYTDEFRWTLRTA